MMKVKSLTEWLSWLETHHPNEIDLGLTRITRVADALNLRNPRGQVITVAGTNGKGSCVAAVSALLQQAGWSVGVYTSPHIDQFNERITINGAQAVDTEIAAAFSAIYDACESFEPAISLTYFEYATLAALYIFNQRDLDAFVLEVGLGGRLDAVNIVDADVAVVTSIDIDHKDWLGDTRELISFEKAGIYRAGRPAICSDDHPPQPLIDHANNIAADLQLVGREYAYHSDEARGVWTWSSGVNTFANKPVPQLPLPSMAAALQVMTNLGVAVTDVSFDCLAALRVPGRFQVLEWRDRTVILDVAHNPAATAFMANKLTLWREQHPQARVWAVVAMMADKDRAASLLNVIDLIDAWCVAELDDVPRAATPAQLTGDLQQLGVMPIRTGRVATCLESLRDLTQPDDVILVFGSFFTVAAGLRAVGFRANTQ